MYEYFLHDRPLISPWIKLISNELDQFTWSCHNWLVIATSSAIYCDVTSRTKTERDTGMMCKDRRFYHICVIFGFKLCRVRNTIMYVSRDELFVRSLECYFGVYLPRCFATGEINSKITLSWALKQFVTRVHTLFSTSSIFLPHPSVWGLKMNIVWYELGLDHDP